MPPPDLVLASTSPYRRALLERLGVAFRCVAPGVDEDAFEAPGLGPVELASALARAKADAVAAREPEAVVVGSDQLVDLDGEVLGKPGNEAAAVAQLARLAGRAHRLVTALCVRRGEERREHVDVTTLTMRPLSRAALERYVARDRPVDCAGAYKLEAAGIALFERIESADHTAITGLPLMALVAALGELGIAVP